MVQTADGSPEEGAGRKDDDMSNPMWAHILRLLDDEEQATMVFQIFKQAMITRAIETDRAGLGRGCWGGGPMGMSLPLHCLPGNS